MNCLGSSAWPERCLGKAKVAGSIPAQGFLFIPKESQFDLIEKPTNSDSILQNSVRLTNYNHIDWDNFQKYLQENFNRLTAKAQFSYSKKYNQMIANGDASRLVVLYFDKRMHVMNALATLSKFLGSYDEWKKIVEKNQLSWSDSGSGGGSSKGLEIFQNIYGKDNFQQMLIQLKEAFI